MTIKLFRSTSLLLLLIAGCSPTFHTVSGTVSLDGKPLGGASVSFIPEGPGQPAVGSADASGRFTLETNNTRGVLPGPYKVVVIKLAVAPADESATAHSPVSPVPAKYGNVKTTPLTLTVPSTGDGAYDVKMVSK